MLKHGRAGVPMEVCIFDTFMLLICCEYIFETFDLIIFEFYVFFFPSKLSLWKFDLENLFEAKNPSCISGYGLDAW